ncbi:hypothetical protein LQ567_11175 [Niabella pedocola]|uniref:SPOR domain-containing protein n=1 Tax=Niabella pedocola TaxID=1752077 RepID=A0ABS8PQH0_9BACT|nr:hypothetical protein [Niabella pedocola]MCD2423324.1 hypothetical protein [Niabella pedocola]
MMKRFLTCMVLLSLITGTVTGQKKDIRHLVRAVVEKAVPPEFAYFHLVDSSFISRYSTAYFDPLEFKTFYKENPRFVLEAFKAANARAKKIYWGKFKIPRARINPYENIPHYEGQFSVVTLLPWSTPDTVLEAKRRNNKYPGVILKIKETWTEAQQKEAIQKERERYANSLQPEDKKYFAISSPIFSKDRRYVIIEVRTALEGWCQVYKKIKGKWVYQVTLSHWMA